jgi:RNA-directed DNA polymerase
MQEGLVDSFARRAVAVRQVTQINTGKRTAGVDCFVALTPPLRMQLVKEL